MAFIFMVMQEAFDLHVLRQGVASFLPLEVTDLADLEKEEK